MHVLFALFALPVLSLASPTSLRARDSLTVHIASTTDYCMVVPAEYDETIGDSEHPGGEAVWCAPGSQGGSGTFSGSFWKDGQVELSYPKDGVVQLTGCINVSSCDRLSPDDGGGQYDSNGGDGGRGNPQNSKCAGYASYVEIIEPNANRACLRCCQNPSDCPVNMDTAGCPQVIQGNYFQCN